MSNPRHIVLSLKLTLQSNRHFFSYSNELTVLTLKHIKYRKINEIHGNDKYIIVIHVSKQIKCVLVRRTNACPEEGFEG